MRGVERPGDNERLRLSDEKLRREEERCAKSAHPSHKMIEGRLDCPSCLARGFPLLRSCAMQFKRVAEQLW